MGETGETPSSSSSSRLPWRVRAQQALRELSGEASGRPEVVPKMDIDPLVADTRVLLENEVVEAMITKRLEAEGVRVTEPAAAAPTAQQKRPRATAKSTAEEGDVAESAKPRSTAKRQNRKQQSNVINGDDAAKRAAESVESTETGADADAPLVPHDIDQVAPLRNAATLRAERLAQIRTQSAQLVAASYEDPEPAYMTAQKVQPLCALASCVDSEAHRTWVDRIATRFTGVQRSPSCWKESAEQRRVNRKSLSECTPADLTGIPADLPRIAPHDVIVTVAVCNQNGTKEQEFDMLASQSLADLRDAFWFVQDWMFDGPRRIKSACFFIDGAFYVDRRHPKALDYSKELIMWLKATDSHILRSSEAKCMSLRLCDLDRVPFGERCVYLHQGDIEHNIVFTGARLVGPADCPLLEAYPVLTFMRRYAKKKCFGCLVAPAIWMVLDSTRTPHNPCFLCGMCFRHFYQDENQDFIPPVDYKVFPYLHDE